MKSLLLILALQFCLVSTAHADETQKDTVKSTLSSLKKNVNNVSQGVNRLKQDKLSIEKSLKDMEEWGNSEQASKEFYFSQNVQLGKDVLEAHKTIAEDKIEINKINERYHHIRSVFGYVAGALAALVYLKIGSAIVSTFAGPYSLLLSFLGPAGAFTLGYSLVRFLF